MIDKFVRIASVGKFGDYSASGDVLLRRVSLIYGENGRGKSTLAAILRSLQTGDGNHITERTTLNRTGKPEVHIKLSGAGLAKFKDGKWDCPPGKIEIFDSNFVYDNIYVGHVVDHEHKKNLYKVIVGEQGVRLSLKVDELDEKVREANKKLAEAKTKVETKIKGGMKIDKFIALLMIPDIDDQIAAQEKVIDALKSAADIAKKSALAKITLPAVPDLTVLGTEIADVSAAAEELVAEHIKTRLDKAGEQWIGKGYEYLADHEECPFCNQNVAGSNLISAYQAHFNETYANLKNEIEEATATVGTDLGPEKLLALQKTLSSNETLLEFWKRFVTIEPPVFDFAAAEAAWKELQQQANALLNAKAGALLDKVAISPAYTAAVTAYEAIQATMETYNAAVDVANGIIATKKADAAAGDLAKEEAKLAVLQNTKERHKPDVVLLCDDYEAKAKVKKDLEKAKDDAKDALDLYANQIFATYQDEMNKLLRDFGTEFTISNTARSFVGGKASSSYEITINKTAVPLGDAKTALGEACFRNTLSMGDRSALALAFFLVKLAHDPDIANKCVVFDDPVCSLDRFRMGCTVEQILKVAEKAKQVIVLCHDPFCLKKIHEKLLAADVKALYIQRKVNDSELIEWDIETATRSAYFEDYFALADFVQNGLNGRDLRDLARKLRVTLEENLRVRFPVEFQTGWLGEFIKSVRDSNPGDALERMKPQLPELINLNDYCKKYHHSENPNAGSEPISEPELRTYTTRAFDFIGGVA